VSRWSCGGFSIEIVTDVTQSPTKIIATQANHFYAAMLAFIKLEKLKLNTKMGHFKLKSELYLAALKAANHQLKLIRA
jgi:hypothetical protein